ncbi:MAG: DNA mismatch repair protein MutH [Proteobacteria bacterium]|nr:DNA mismatch repair protein MutH [Pseudomonadota bacterium]
MPVTGPQSLEALLTRAGALQGATIGAVAARCGVSLERGRAGHKGRVGELIERALGASAQSLDLPDFPQLGVELKTVPLDALGRVRESTFVCTIDLLRAADEVWEGSRLWSKLRCVLWVPVEPAGSAPLALRRLGRALLWRPSAAEEALLRADWTALIGLIAVGGVEELSAHLGEALQVRPKAADGRARTSARGPDGEALAAMPRAFYLRARFTEALLWSLTAR